MGIMIWVRMFGNGLNCPAIMVIKRLWVVHGGMASVRGRLIMGQQSLREWPLFMLALGAFLTDRTNLLIKIAVSWSKPAPF